MRCLYSDATNDTGRRYTFFQNEVFVDASDPQLKGWMPGHGGIFYAGNMRFFYSTFFKNPQGDWRYIAGFEPALMPPDDLNIYRTIQRTAGAIEAYEPWVAKMRPQDRLEVESPSEPRLPALEWKRAGGEVWIPLARSRDGPLILNLICADKKWLHFRERLDTE